MLPCAINVICVFGRERRGARLRIVRAAIDAVRIRRDVAAGLLRADHQRDAARGGAAAGVAVAIGTARVFLGHGELLPHDTSHVANCGE